MTNQAWLRLFLSALVAFCAYASWAYYANSLVTNESSVLIKAALVQGSYSALVTLAFTFMLEVFFKKFGATNYCLPFIVPRFSKDNPPYECCSTLATFEKSLQVSEQKCHGKCLPGSLLSPLPALFIQSILVIAVNIVFATPNLWLTVAPSIGFSAIYGYVYSFGLAKAHNSATN